MRQSRRREIPDEEDEDWIGGTLDDSQDLSSDW